MPPKPLEQANQGGGSPSSSRKNGGGRVVLYTVLLDVDNDDQALMAEMTAQIFFVAGSAQNTLTAPLSALKNGTQGDLQTAQVLTASGEVQNRQVRTGISDRLRVQILDGLEEGDRLLVPSAPGSGG